MVDKLDYIISNVQCQEALEELEGGCIESVWVLKHILLYNKVTYGPEGLPTISDCTFEGEYYQYISMFHKKYKSITYLSLFLDN